MLLKLTKLSFLVLVVCSSSTAQGQLLNNYVTGCVPEGDFDPTIDYFPEKYEPPSIFTYDVDTDIYGERFVPHNTTDLLEINYFGNYKIIVNKLQNVSYLLYQCGTVPPQDEIDSGRHHLVLPVPHQGGVAVTETPQIPPLELLGLREEIVGYIGNPDFVSSPCLLHRINEGSDIEVVYNPEDPWNQTINDQLRSEFVQRNPDVIVFGGPLQTAPFPDRTINIAASQERTNVATFDWIALYAALYNMEGMSNRIGQETQDRYDCTSSNARLIVGQRDLQEESDVVVQSINKTADQINILWAVFFDGYGWSVAECPTWDHTYYCEYATHCGTNIISRPPEFGTENWGYWYLSDEELLELGGDADLFIFPDNRWLEIYEQKKDILDQFKSVQTKQVYDTQGSGGNTWYESRLAEYDVVALDMCELVGTANPMGPPHRRRWFRNVFTEPVGELPACNVPDELTEPYVPRGAECELLALEDFIDQPEEEEEVVTMPEEEAIEDETAMEKESEQDNEEEEEDETVEEDEPQVVSRDTDEAEAVSSAATVAMTAIASIVATVMFL